MAGGNEELLASLKKSICPQRWLNCLGTLRRDDIPAMAFPAWALKAIEEGVNRTFFGPDIGAWLEQRAKGLQSHEAIVLELAADKHNQTKSEAQ